MTTLEIRMNGLENNQSALHADMIHVNQRLDNPGTRIERIERRLDLIDS